MGWEQRGNRDYYYRKERAGGAVRSVYVSGVVGQLAARLDEAARLEREEARRAVALDRAEDKRSLEACQRLRHAARDLLLAAGFHQHKREWRRPRMPKVSKADNETARRAFADSELLIQALMTGDPSAPARALVAEDLKRPAAWRDLGDLMGNALAESVGNLATGSYYRGESLKRGLEEMRAQLGFDGATLPERLLIEQVLLCWLRLSVLEGEQTRAMKGRQAFAYLNYLETATTLAQRRYTNAITSLARVRRLLRPRGPLFQVNVLAVSAGGTKGPEPITLPAEDVKQLGGD